MKKMISLMFLMMFLGTSSVFSANLDKEFWLYLNDGESDTEYNVDNEAFLKLEIKSTDADFVLSIENKLNVLQKANLAKKELLIEAAEDKNNLDKVDALKSEQIAIVLDAISEDVFTSNISKKDIKSSCERLANYIVYLKRVQITLMGYDTYFGGKWVKKHPLHMGFWVFMNGNGYTPRDENIMLSSGFVFGGASSLSDRVENMTHGNDAHTYALKLMSLIQPFQGIEKNIFAAI